MKYSLSASVPKAYSTTGCTVPARYPYIAAQITSASSMSRLGHLACAIAAALVAACALPAVAADECQDKCWKEYNAEIDDCINTTDVSGLLEPTPPDGFTEVSAAAVYDTKYTGPQVDVEATIREQCRQNVGQTEVNSCLNSCNPSPAPPPSPPPPAPPSPPPPPPPPPFPPPPPPTPCENKCWDGFKAEIENCVNEADISGLLTPTPPPDAATSDELSAKPKYTGPQVDALKAVRKQCKENIGTAKLNTCLDDCASVPLPIPAPASDQSCDEVCTSNYKKGTVGRLRCQAWCLEYYDYYP